MSKKWRTYSVFVSSTFSDMQSERDYLRMHVFPLVNDELRKYCIKLRVIDLRWGINTLDVEEEHVEEKVLRVCLEEINRSKPFFLALIGNRYGYIPKNEYAERIDRAYRDLSITAIEITHGFLKRNDVAGCLFMERSSACYANMDKAIVSRFDDSSDNENAQNAAKLKQLKKQIQAHLAKNHQEDKYHTYSPSWNGEKFENLDAFGQIVKQSIIDEVKSYYVHEGNDEPFADEERNQNEFLYLRSQRLYSREDIIDVVDKGIEEDKNLIIISGESGSGKSSIYTLLVEKYSGQTERNVVLYHSTDTGKSGHDALGMLKRWCFQLEGQTCKSHTELSSYDDAVTYFRNLTKRIPEGKRLLLFIDGVEEFKYPEASAYLAFIPKSVSGRLTAVCTCPQQAADKISQYHKNAAPLFIPSLSLNEKKGIIRRFSEFENKELYDENIQTLIEKSSGIASTSELPLWLSLALNYISTLGREDFNEATKLSLKHNKSFDKGLIEYIDKQINAFPSNPNKLFWEFLLTLSSHYGSFPIKLCQILSASYNGLDEDVLAELFKEDWDLKTFAAVRSLLQGFLAEQGQMKTWGIMHKILKSDDETAKDKLACELSKLYIRKYRNDEVVNDNILYYLIKANDAEAGLDYLLDIDKNTTRITEELYQVFESEETSRLMTFLGACYNCRRKGMRRFIPRAILLSSMKDVILIIAERALYEGKYDKADAVIESFQDYMAKQPISADIRMIYHIITDAKRFSALEKLYPQTKLRTAYENALAKLAIKGPLSLMVVPITRRYYKWNIFKL